MRLRLPSNWLYDMIRSFVFHASSLYWVKASFIKLVSNQTSSYTSRHFIIYCRYKRYFSKIKKPWRERDQLGIKKSTASALTWLPWKPNYTSWTPMGCPKRNWLGFWTNWSANSAVRSSTRSSDYNITLLTTTENQSNTNQMLPLRAFKEGKTHHILCNDIDVKLEELLPFTREWK